MESSPLGGEIQHYVIEHYVGSLKKRERNLTECNWSWDKCHVILLKLIINRPFPSSLVPLFQSESKCETILMKMTLICMKIKLHAELIFI